MPVLFRPVNNFLGQVIGNASEGKYNTVNNSSSGEVTFQKCLNSGITLFSSKNSNKSQTLATGVYQRLQEARPRPVVWLWEPEYDSLCLASPANFIYGRVLAKVLSHVTIMPVLLRPVNNFLGQIIGNVSEGEYNTVNNSSSGEVIFQKCVNSGITLFSSKNSN